MSARNIVITGANGGLGFEALRQLLALDSKDEWKIVVGGRDSDRASKAVQSLMQPPYDRKLVSGLGLAVDLGDLDSVRDFARQVVENVKSEGIDVLVLNAGIWKASRRNGKAGWSEEMEVNHLNQHHLLQLLLLELRKAASKGSTPRIVFVSSELHRRVPSDSEELVAILRGTLPAASGQAAYSASKWAQQVGCQYWRSHLAQESAGAPHIDVVSVTPGFVPSTNLIRDQPFPLRFLGHLFLPLLPFSVTLQDGGARIVQAITMPSEELRGPEATGYLAKREWAEVEPRTKEARWWGELCLPLPEDQQGGLDGNVGEGEAARQR